MITGVKPIFFRFLMNNVFKVDLKLGLVQLIGTIDLKEYI